MPLNSNYDFVESCAPPFHVSSETMSSRRYKTHESVTRFRPFELWTRPVLNDARSRRGLATRGRRAQPSERRRGSVVAPARGGRSVEVQSRAWDLSQVWVERVLQGNRMRQR